MMLLVRDPTVVLAALVVLSAAGCRQTLMPTPVAFYDDNSKPFAAVPDAERKTTCDVYVFTDREPSGKPRPAPFYSDHRSREGRLAVATVAVGANMDWPELRLESVREHRDRDPVLEFIGLEEMGLLWTTVPPEPVRFVPEPVADDAAKAPAERFAREVNAKLARSNLKDILIFVHGFNTEFNDNQQLAAELHHYLGREGVVITYAWPSLGSLFGYSADKADAQYSTRMFRVFLAFLAENTDARRINILGHSAGAPIVVDAVRQLRLIHYREDPSTIQAQYRIGQLVLAAPDMDLFQYINADLDGLEDVPDRVTIYISTKDVALDLASGIYKFARLGEPLAALTPEELQNAAKHKKLDVINVSLAEKKHGSFLGHSYFHKDPWVSSDLLLLLRYAVPARERGLVRAEGRANWTFPEDYPQRVKAIAADLEKASR